MKKIIGIIFITILYINLNAREIEHTYQFSQPKIKNLDSWKIVEFDEMRQSGKLGEPLLPYRSVALLLPIGEEAVDIKIEFSEIEYLSEDIQLYPAQEASPISLGKSGEFRINQEVYRLDTEYPIDKYTGITTAFKNGHPIAMTTFTPAIYNPVNHKFGYYKTAKVILITKKTEKAEKAKKLLREDEATIKSIKQLIDNPEEMNSFKSSRDPLYDVMIITDAIYENSFGDLIEHYLKRGLRADIFTTEQINENYDGIDLQEKMRNAVIDEYINSEISFLLLAGDAAEVPARGFYCYVVSGAGVESYDIPSDIYFSALDGTWNDDNDYMWGEPEEDDLLPEIAVGRIPFSSEEELQIAIHKTISYQENPVLGELETPLMIGERLWDDPLTWGADYLDLLIGWHDDNGYETEGIPTENQITTLYDRELGTWDAMQLIDEINSGHSYLHHSGHSNSTYNMRLYDTYITNDYFPLVNGEDHNYTLIYSHGCIAGAFDIEDCIAERMLNIDNFMVVGTFNSRYGWFNEGQTEGPSEHLHREYLNAIYGNDICEVGSAHTESKIASAPWVTMEEQHEFGALRWCMYTSNLIGDPALRFWKGEPIEVDFVFDEEIDSEDSFLDYTVTSNQEPIAGACITIIDDGEFIAKGYTNENGTCSINIAGLLENSNGLDIYLSGNDFITQHYVTTISNTDSSDNLSLQTNLKNAFPNPFNPETTISFSLADNNDVQLEIYNSKGRKVKTLIDQNMEPGFHKAIWQGKDNNNNNVSSGIYFYRLKTNDNVYTKKMILLK